MTINIGRFETDAELPGGLRPQAITDRSYRSRGVYRLGGKRILDVLLVLLSAPFVLPIVLLLAIFVSRDGGSAFYSQQRVGRGGRIYKMWKLRSMVVDADARMKELLASDPEARREWDQDQKLKNDPRITKFGQILRKSSMDELPQLWNVLIGDMSLVGPRPMMVEQRALYPSTAYYELRPGITGAWQTSGRNKTTFAARAEYDTDYERNLSLSTDVTLLFKTVGVVVKATGC